VNDNSSPALEKAMVLIFGLLFIAVLAYMGTRMYKLEQQLDRHMVTHTRADNTFSNHLDRTANEIKDRLKSTQSEMRRSIQEVKQDVNLTHKVLLYALVDSQTADPDLRTIADRDRLQNFEKQLADTDQPGGSRITASTTTAAETASYSSASRLRAPSKTEPDRIEDSLQQPEVLGTTASGKPVYASAPPNGSMVIRRSDERKMAVNFVGARLETIIEALKEVSGLNFKLGPGIDEKITLILEKQIAWERVLNILLLRYNLEIKKSGQNVILVRSRTVRG